jgi:hypothetical protein
MDVRLASLSRSFCLTLKIHAPLLLQLHVQKSCRTARPFQMVVHMPSLTTGA